MAVFLSGLSAETAVLGAAGLDSKGGVMNLRTQGAMLAINWSHVA